VSSAKELFQIDIHELDVEWMNLPQLYYEYASKLGAARVLFEQAKNHLEEVKAKLDADIRANPDVYGVTDDKLTEPRIERIILTQPEYKQAFKSYLNARKRYELLKAVVNALDYKRSALENLVKLYASQYFMVDGLPNIHKVGGSR